jgi:hypothetical protein
MGRVPFSESSYEAYMAGHIWSADPLEQGILCDDEIHVLNRACFQSLSSMRLTYLREPRQKKEKLKLRGWRMKNKKWSGYMGLGLGSVCF